MIQINPQQPEHKARYSRTTFYRHSKNISEFVLIMALSTGATFLARILPLFWIAVLIIKLIILIYLVALTKEDESKRLSSLMRGTAIFIGLLGGLWDIAYLYLMFDLELLARWIAFGIAVLLIVSAMALGLLQVKFEKRW